MKQHITVVPSDNLIIVDGEALRFAFDAPASLHALQWHNGQGHMEFTDDYNHMLLGDGLYAEDVTPFVRLWEAEKRGWRKKRPLPRPHALPPTTAPKPAQRGFGPSVTAVFPPPTTSWLWTIP